MRPTMTTPAPTSASTPAGGRAGTRQPKWRLKVAAGIATLAAAGTVLAAPPDAWWADIVNDREENVVELLAQGIDPNDADPEGIPALMLAIRTGAWNTYDRLLAHRKINVNIENRHGETPLMYLAVIGDTRRAEALIERGAQVNRLGWTPLHYAVSKGHVETARMLLKRGAIVNAPAPDGTTPLMMAAFSGDRETIQLLLDHDADATALTLQKLSAADWARERGHTRIADELENIAERTQARREGRPEPARIAPPPEPEKPAVKEAPASQGGSRYFDLDRFERED